MSRRALSILPLLVVVAAVVDALLAGGAVSDLLLSFAPVAVLVSVLLAGRYVGASRLAEFVTRARAKPRRRSRVRMWSPGQARAGVRGGRLIAHSLAERGPPALVALGG